MFEQPGCKLQTEGVANARRVVEAVSSHTIDRQYVYFNELKRLQNSDIIFQQFLRVLKPALINAKQQRVER